MLQERLQGVCTGLYMGIQSPSSPIGSAGFFATCFDDWWTRTDAAVGQPAEQQLRWTASTTTFQRVGADHGHQEATIRRYDTYRRSASDRRSAWLSWGFTD
jgi:hypothetical protein